MQRTYTVPVSAAGRRVSLVRTFRDVLSAAGLRGRVIACDLDWTAPAMHVADAGFIAPRCTDPSFPDWAVDLCSGEPCQLHPTEQEAIAAAERAVSDVAGSGDTLGLLNANQRQMEAYASIARSQSETSHRATVASITDSSSG